MESGQADVEGLTGAGARVASAWPEANTGLRRLHAFGLIASSILTLLLILCLVLSYGSSSSWPPATAEQRFVAKDLSHSRLIPGVHFVKGSAAHDALQHHRWFVGHFMPAEQLQYSEEVELKWAARKAGESNGEIATNMKARSMNILLHGKIRFEVSRFFRLRVIVSCRMKYHCFAVRRRRGHASGHARR
mmetsp:Transcript_4468/g.16019  ORF Transcript_4468/g.16019 Transcript_4468/m.16019 type:complete len:190 (-) Transcript_4468:2558-3127(-)